MTSTVETFTLKIHQHGAGKIRARLLASGLPISKLRFDTKRSRLYGSFSEPTVFNPTDFVKVKRKKKKTKNPPPLDESEDEVEILEEHNRQYAIDNQRAMHEFDHYLEEYGRYCRYDDDCWTHRVYNSDDGGWCDEHGLPSF
jgi:hypothetical protein